MLFPLHSYAVLVDGKVTRFQSVETVQDGETLLPVIADEDPPLGPNDKLWGPDYEILSDRVRAYCRAVPMEPEEIAEREVARPKLTFSQLLIGLVAEQWVTEAEGEAWLLGTLPAGVVALIGTLPLEQRFPARARATAPTVVYRDDPLVIALGASQGKTPEQIDAFFVAYCAV